ncbi:MAG TPA: 4-alpha-glucanotransferase, partial [Acidimicrobiia bacterium]|nr:4-alpha-glucanotransferase [Acidimicrobiia bacterium]
MSALPALARDLGIDVTWQTHAGDDARVREETLLALVNLLGAAVRTPADADGARQAWHRQRMARVLEPTTVVWDSRTPRLRVYVPASQTDAPLECHLELDDGHEWHAPVSKLPVDVMPVDVNGYVRLDVRLPTRLPTGVHTARVTGAGVSGASTVIATPSRIPTNGVRRAWGVFAPLYALHDAVDDGPANLATLARFGAWAHGRGAQVVGTLPLLATYYGAGNEPCDPSPYAPVSRRFWNEAYLDLDAVPGTAPRAGRALEGATIDPPALAADARARLEPLVEALRAQRAFQLWIERRDDVRAYASFRATTEGNPAARTYHEIAQWLVERQLHDLVDEFDDRRQLLYLDLPLGSHPLGFDVHEGGDTFLRGATVGAPPDAFQPDGQDWGFTPLHPDRARVTGHRHLRECLEAQFRFARLLRIDHVMGLDRLWIIPDGMAASDGAYVRYASEEQWATVCLTANTSGAGVVGENLGTVPAATNRALRAHDGLGMWVLEFEVPEDATPATPRADALACCNTHDLDTFATWWDGLSPRRRARLAEVLRAADVLHLHEGEGLDPHDVLGACYAWLGRSDAAIVLVTLEDLWLETEPQNRP